MERLNYESFLEEKDLYHHFISLGVHLEKQSLDSA